MMRLRAAALSIFLLGLSGCGDIRYEGNDGALTTTDTDTSSDEVGQECVPLAVDVEPVFEELGLQSADGKQLAATIARPGSATCRPGLVLIHQFGLDRSQWAPHVPAFVEAGYVVLTLDLRGHGQSDPADGALTRIRIRRRSTSTPPWRPWLRTAPSIPSVWPWWVPASAPIWRWSPCTSTRRWIWPCRSHRECLRC